MLLSSLALFAGAVLPAVVPPALGCYFVHQEDLDPSTARAYLDLVAAHSGFTHLTTSMRIPKGELTDEFIHEAIRGIAEYAATLHIGIVMDLDVRLAREAFRREHPNELQEMLRIREKPRQPDGDTLFEIAAETPSDHYTFQAIPYVPVASRLVRAYAFTRTPQGIDMNSLVDITAACRIEEQGKNTIRIAVPDKATERPAVCVCVAFAHLTPDVFAEHLLDYQRGLLRRYAEVKLAGACKDEWGFPPCFDGTPKHDDFWYSEAMAGAYRTIADRDLVRDCVAVYAGSDEAERQGAINRFLKLVRDRNAAIEQDFYLATKEVFGADAMVATHPTWYPHPDRREYKKNGLDWWAARRDYAQTDEVTPFCVRTALAKKWNNTVWYNMYYSSKKHDYETSLWSHALAGGRVNFHPIYPCEAPPGWNMSELYTGGLMRGTARVRLLDFIQPTPLDCPVAVIFGHACAMNWAGPAYEDVGLGLADALWREGYYADLIPASEIGPGGLTFDGSAIRYGTQTYRAAIMYHPEFEPPSTAAFLNEAAKGGTRLFRVGDWTRGFDGTPFAGDAALPSSMVACADAPTCAREVIAALAGSFQPETPATDTMGWEAKNASPPASGHCHLLDGTRLVLAGEHDPAGDPIQATLDVDGHEVVFDAVGVAAVRLDSQGVVQAVAAGGLRHFKAGSLELRLDTPVDVALWRDADGTFHGVINGKAPLEAALESLTHDWVRLREPEPLEK